MAKKKVNIDTKGYKYGTIRIRDAKSGKVRYSAGNGDAVAKAMLIFTAKGGKLTETVKANDLGLKQGNRNDGLFRMSIGGALRAKVRNGESVKIGSIVVKSLKQKVALPKVEGKAPVKPVRKAKPRKPRKSRTEATPAAAPVADAA